MTFLRVKHAGSRHATESADDDSDDLSVTKFEWKASTYLFVQWLFNGLVFSLIERVPKLGW